MAAVVRHDTTTRLAHVGVPTLVVTGAEDRLVPPHNSRTLAALIQGAEHVEIQGAGHCFPFEKLEETTAALLSLFRRAPAAATLGSPS